MLNISKYTYVYIFGYLSSSLALSFHQRLTLFCTQDEVPVCAHCLLVGDHLNHPRVFVSDAFHNSLEDMKPHASRVEKREQQLRDALDHLADRSVAIQKTADDIQINVKQQFDRLRAILDAREKEMITQVQMQSREKRQHLDELSDKTSAVLRVVQRTRAVVTHAMAYADPYSWLSNAANLEVWIGNFFSVSFPPCLIDALGCERDV